jgi:shikimate dehydrogenase
MAAEASVYSTGLLGGAITRSLSPAMHDAAFAYHELSERYTLWPVSEAELPAYVESLRAPGMRGANVTIPHKAAALALVDKLGTDPDVAALQALNTIIRHEDGSLLGINTDVDGFLRALRAGGFEPAGAGVVLLGAGGAARAVAWGLIRSGVRSLVVANRSRERASRLLAAVSSLPEAAAVQTALLAPDDPALEPAVRGASLLVNATPIGGDGAACPLDDHLLHPGLFVSDLIYRPTPLLRAAAQRGAQGQDGLEMLVQQGALAFEAWTGLAAPVDEMRRAAIEARAAAS